jgi:hypothetical protein
VLMRFEVAADIGHCASDSYYVSDIGKLVATGYHAMAVGPSRNPAGSGPILLREIGCMYQPQLVPGGPNRDQFSERCLPGAISACALGASFRKNEARTMRNACRWAVVLYDFTRRVLYCIDFWAMIIPELSRKHFGRDLSGADLRRSSVEFDASPRPQHQRHS